MYIVIGQDGKAVPLPTATEAAELMREPWDSATLSRTIRRLEPGDRLLVDNGSFEIICVYDKVSAFN